MKIKRFFAPDIRQAMRMVKEELGADAVIMSNKSVDGGVEIVAARDFDEQLIQSKTLEVGASQPYATIQSAITDSSAGDTVYVHNGAYNGGINITNGIKLVGESKVGVVVTQDSATTSGQGISIDGVNGATISNITFNSPAGSPIYYALKAYQSANLTLNNLTFNGPGKNGLNARSKKIGGVDVNSSQNVNYNNISVNNYSKNGFSFTAKYASLDTATSNLNLSNIAANNNGWQAWHFTQ